MLFLRDLLCLSSGRLCSLLGASNSLEVVGELLTYYGRSAKLANILIKNSTDNRFINGIIKDDSEILKDCGDVIRLAIMNSNNCIGLLGITYRGYMKYEVSYFVSKDFRGKSNISSLLDLAKNVVDMYNIRLIARTTDDNLKSKHLIEEHLKLTSYCRDKDNNILFRMLEIA